jgi:uncharacterized protein (DUF1778 family)
MGGKTSNKSKAMYNAKTYDRINIAVPKGQKDVIKQIADSKGVSVNGFIQSLINEAIEREQAGKVMGFSTQEK